MFRTLLALSLFTGIAAADEVRPLKLEEVDQVIEKHDREVQHCSTRSHGKDQLAVLVRLDIDANGKVVSVEPTQAKAPPEAKCLSRVVKKFQFPAVGAETRIEYPFMLSR